MQHSYSLACENTSVHRLPNGLTVVLEPLPYLRSVAAGVWVKVGSACESAGMAGVSHFLEHLFFKGTDSRSARQLVEAVESRGGHLNAFTSRDYTCVYVKTLDTHVDNALEVLADIYLHSQFNDFEKERNVILEEIASVEDVPEDFVHDLYCERIWPQHPLGMPITGTEASVSALGLDAVRDYFRHWYTAGNTVVSVAGNFDPDAVREGIAGRFGPAAGDDVGPCPDAPNFGTGLSAVTRAIAQHHLCFGFPAPGASDERRYLFDMLASVLGGGSTSRLFERIREDAGLAYTIYAFNYAYLQSGTLGVYAAVAPENLRKTTELACEELRKLRDTPAPEEEIAMNKEQLKGNLLMALEGTFNRMARMAKSMIYHGRILPVDEIVAGIDAVTAVDLQQLAADLFTPECCATVVLGPKSPKPAKVMPL